MRKQHNAILQCIFNGEFGWEIMQWQGYCRKISRQFDKTYFLSSNQSDFLYQDFSEKGFVEAAKTISYQQYQLIPFENQELIAYGESNAEFDYLIHARDARFEYRNYPIEKWEEVVKKLKGKIASIGTQALHIKGTIDKRNIDLKTLTNYMAGAKCIIGPSSGPMHLAGLCNCKRVIWGDKNIWIGNETNKKRYEESWNPFNIPTMCLETNDWKPEVSEIVGGVNEIASKKWISSSMAQTRKKIWIALLNQESIRPELSNAALKLAQDNRYDFKISYSNARPIINNRNQIAKSFLENEYDYLLMIDSDTVPLKNPLDLVELNKDIIACPCPQWHETDIYWVVMDKVNGGYKAVPVDRRNGLQEVDAVGTGCILIARRVLEKMKFPFQRIWSEDGIQELGQDFNFCEKAKNLGFKVWAHWDYPCSHYKTIDLLSILKLLGDK